MLHFVHPVWLFGLLFLPLLALMHWQQVQRAQSAFEAYAREPLRRKMDLRTGLGARSMRGALILAALACGLVALAQPRWGGSTGDAAAASRQGNLVVVLDVSKSMLTRDVHGESRLAASQRLLHDLLPELAGWRIGVVAFAGEGVPLAPLTTDHEAVATLLERAQPGGAAGKGSSIEAGLKAATPLFTQPGRRVLLLLSDGEQLQGKVESAVAALRDRQVEVLAVGAGSAEGGYVPGATDMWGNPGYVVYQGEKVVSRLAEAPLKGLAERTGGHYWTVEGGAERGIAKRLGSLATASVVTAESPDTGFELFQLPLALMLLLLVAEALWGFSGRRRSELRFGELLSERLRRGAPALVYVAIALTQGAWSWYPSWLPNGEAGRAYQSKQYDKAATILDKALKADPNNFRLLYNAGNAAYQRGHYQEALNHFTRAWDLADADSRPTISYNQGNAHFRLAEAANDPAGFKRAITEYERVLAARPQDADARHNLEVARQRLKQLQQQKPQNEGNRGGGSSGNNQAPVGVDHVRRPLPPMGKLPPENEVDALLKALESDERQRQAEQGGEAAQADGQSDPFSQGTLLQQALGSLEMEKDW